MNPTGYVCNVGILKIKTMAFVPSITVTQPSGFPNIVKLEDDSTGSDGAITQRRAYLQTAYNTYLVEEGVTTDYNQWSYAAQTIQLDVLDKDYALFITVDWLDVNNTILHTLTLPLSGLTQYNEACDYGLTQIMSGNPLLVGSNNFLSKKFDLRTYIDSGDQAVGKSDIFSAQIAYDLATEIRLNKNSLFGLLT